MAAYEADVASISRPADASSKRLFTVIEMSTGCYGDSAPAERLPFFLLGEVTVREFSMPTKYVYTDIRQTHIVITAAPGRTIEYDTYERMYDIFVDIGNGNTSRTHSGKT